MDTGILLAYFNEYDAYYSAVKELFDHYIYGTNTSVFLYVNPTTVNEITHLAQDPVKRYLAAHPADQTKFDMTTLNTLQDKITNGVKGLIEDEILYVSLCPSDKKILFKYSFFQEYSSILLC